MLVTLLFPLLLFVVVLALFGIEHRFVPPGHQPQEPAPDSLAAHQEEIEGSLPHYIYLWERIDSAVGEEQHGRSLRPVNPSSEARRLVARPSFPAAGEPHAAFQGGSRTHERHRRRGRRTATRRPAA